MHHIKTAATLVICILIMQYLHEFGHALMSKSLGYDVLMTVNKVHSSGGSGDVPLRHSILIALAGPAVTIALSLLAYLSRAKLGMLAPIIIFNAMIMRTIATAVSLSHPNDEAWVSATLGIGMWTLPALVCGLLAGIFIAVLREEKPDWPWYLAMWAGVSIGYSAVVLGERYFPSFAF
ncbi:hypothetical protein [Pontixanthobacter sp. CEM42]|uniref:hypothetical protein n=1 Tax=Pontixanthobacter sp. CEM42 TaxID=2792077 RepID=UPI001AE057CE|nr:hypothetical protein [Pontixanthobacter sp. CEM42]